MANRRSDIRLFPRWLTSRPGLYRTAQIGKCRHDGAGRGPCSAAGVEDCRAPRTLTQRPSRVESTTACRMRATSARMRAVRQPKLRDDLDAVQPLPAARARASGRRPAGDARGARILRLAGAPLRARRLGRLASARGRSRPPVPARAAGALRVEGPADCHLLSGRRRVRGGVAHPASHAARASAFRPRSRVRDQHPRRPPSWTTWRTFRSPTSPTTFSRSTIPQRTPTAPGQSLVASPVFGEVIVSTDARTTALMLTMKDDDAYRALLGKAQPAADRAVRGRHRRCRARRGRLRAGRHRTVLRIGEAPRHREPARRDRRHPRRACGVRGRRHAASRRRADDRRRHDHLRAQRPRRLRHRRGGVPRDRAQPDLPRSALGGAPARRMLLRRPAHDRDARPRGLEGDGDLVELPGPDAHHHHLDEHPPHGALSAASPRLSRAFAPRPGRHDGPADGVALPLHRAHHHHRIRFAGVQRHQAGHRLRSG